MWRNLNMDVYMLPVLLWFGVVSISGLQGNRMKVIQGNGGSIGQLWSGIYLNVKERVEETGSWRVDGRGWNGKEELNFRKEKGGGELALPKMTGWVCFTCYQMLTRVDSGAL